MESYNGLRNKYGQLIDKGEKANQWRIVLFHRWCWNNWTDIHNVKTETDTKSQTIPWYYIQKLTQSDKPKCTSNSKASRRKQKTSESGLKIEFSLYQKLTN